MTDKKFTDEQIIKALGICFDALDCTKCPYLDIREENELCDKNILNDTLDLINRLKAERNKYKIKAQYQKGELARLNKQVAEQKAEIKKLNALFDSAQDNAFKALRLGLDLRKKIHHQRVELDKKDTEIDILIRKKEALSDEVSELKAEIERLKFPKFLVENTLSEKEISEMLKMGRVGVVPHIEYSIKRIDEDGIRAEAIKEFAERLTSRICDNIEQSMNNADGDNYFITDVYTDIDKLEEEMLEGGEADA